MTKTEYELFKTIKPLFKRVGAKKCHRIGLPCPQAKKDQTFYQEEYYTSSAFKLHFIIKTDDINFFKSVFRYLEDKRHWRESLYRKGRFKIDVLDEISFEESSSRKFITLSGIFPLSQN